jgi:hypothetical protein
MTQPGSHWVMMRLSRSVGEAAETALSWEAPWNSGTSLITHMRLSVPGKSSCISSRLNCMPRVESTYDDGEHWRGLAADDFIRMVDALVVLPRWDQPWAPEVELYRRSVQSDMIDGLAPLS